MKWCMRGRRDTTTYVRDADDLTCRLQGVHVGPRDVLVTYDVVNLYPSIPHDLCLDIRERQNRILRKLGLHYTITHTYNVGQGTHSYLESSNTPTALRRPRHGSGPGTPGPGSAWASPRERPPRSLAPALVPKGY